jgi:integral membrane sensor domain MASE1
MSAAPRTTPHLSESRLKLVYRNRKRRFAWELIYVFLAYVIAGKVGLAVPFTSGNVSPLWPPAGIALAATLLCGFRIWPAVALGAFVVNFFSGIHESRLKLVYRNISLQPELLSAILSALYAARGCCGASPASSVPLLGCAMYSGWLSVVLSSARL